VPLTIDQATTTTDTSSSRCVEIRVRKSPLDCGTIQERKVVKEPFLNRQYGIHHTRLGDPSRPPLGPERTTRALHATETGERVKSQRCFSFARNPYISNIEGQRFVWLYHRRSVQQSASRTFHSLLEQKIFILSKGYQKRTRARVYDKLASG
jgi:hypothetical protein